jgi:hypothetical protein
MVGLGFALDREHVELGVGADTDPRSVTLHHSFDRYSRTAARHGFQRLTDVIASAATHPTTTTVVVQ